MAVRVAGDIVPLFGDVVPIDGAFSKPVTESGGDWNLITTSGVYRPGNALNKNRPWDGTDWTCLVSVDDPSDPQSRVQQIAIRPQGGRGRHRPQGSSTWTPWEPWEGKLPAYVAEGSADRRQGQNLQTQQQEISEVKVKITAARIFTGADVFGYSPGGGTATNHVAGGTIERMDGGLYSELNSPIQAIYTNDNNDLDGIEVDSDTPLIFSMNIGDNVYELTRSEDNTVAGTSQGWTGKNYDRYVVVSSAANRKPLNFSSGSVVENISFTLHNGRPLFFKHEESEQTFDWFGARRWLGQIGVESEVSGIVSSLTQFERLAAATGTDTPFIFSHHPILDTTAGSASANIRIPTDHDDIRLVKGSPRIFSSSSMPGALALGRDEQVLSDDLDQVTMRHFDLPEEPVNGQVLLAFGPDTSASTNKFTAIYNVNTRRLETVAPATIEIAGSASEGIWATWVTGSDTPFVDQNFISTQDTDTSGAAAQNGYRLFGSKTALDAFHAEAAAWEKRKDGTKAKMLWVDVDGVAKEAEIDSIGTVQSGSPDDNNTALHSLLLSFRLTNSKKPANGSSVVVSIPKPLPAHSGADPLRVGDPKTWKQNVSPREHSTNFFTWTTRLSGQEPTSSGQASPDPDDLAVLKLYVNATEHAWLKDQEYIWYALSAGATRGTRARLTYDFDDGTNVAAISLSGVTNWGAGVGSVGPWSAFKVWADDAFRTVNLEENAGKYIPWPDEAEELHVSITASSDFSHQAYIQYNAELRGITTTGWKYIFGPWGDTAWARTGDRKGALSTLAGGRVDYVFRRDPFYWEHDDALHIRIENRDASDELETMSGEVTVTVGYYKSKARNRVYDRFAGGQTVANTHPTGVDAQGAASVEPNWTKLEIPSDALVVDDIQYLDIYYRPQPPNNSAGVAYVGTERIRLDAGDIRELQSAYEWPTSSTDAVSLIMQHGYLGRRSAPTLKPSRSLIGALQDGIPIVWVRLDLDGVFVRGVYMASAGFRNAANSAILRLDGIDITFRDV